MRRLHVAVVAVYVLATVTNAQDNRRGGGLSSRDIEDARRRGMTFNVAPTMRMSIFDVVERIGGARAQGILARQLEITARGAEIVHLDGNLERLTGETYVDEILATTKFVLANAIYFYSTWETEFDPNKPRMFNCRTRAATPRTFCMCMG